jgi:hypothetical protein
MLTGIIDFGCNAQQAIEARRWRMGRPRGTASRDLALDAPSRFHTGYARDGVTDVAGYPKPIVAGRVLKIT